jgi:hypothetical protein
LAKLRGMLGVKLSTVETRVKSSEVKRKQEIESTPREEKNPTG